MATAEGTDYQDVVIDRKLDQHWSVRAPKDVKEKLQKRISFDFVETPMVRVVSTLQLLSGLNIILDAAAVEGDDVSRDGKGWKAVVSHSGWETSHGRFARCLQNSASQLPERPVRCGEL